MLIQMREFRFEPDVLSIPAGTNATLYVVNNGRVYHTFTVLELRLDSGVMRPGETKVISFVAPASPSTYQITCTEEGHDEEGMLGKLVVQ